MEGATETTRKLDFCLLSGVFCSDIEEKFINTNKIRLQTTIFARPVRDSRTLSSPPDESGIEQNT